MPSKEQATRYTQKQLAYISYWESFGYRFKPGARVPEDTCVAPTAADMPRALELIVTSLSIAGLLIWGYAYHHLGGPLPW